MTTETFFKHGTATAYINHKCRCFQCRVWNSHKQSQYRRNQLYGIKSYFVDAKPVRAHLRKLIKNGAAVKTLARQIDVGQTTLNELLNGRPESRRNDRPRYKSKVARIVADKIFAIPLTQAKDFNPYVDGHKVQRRVQALAAIGYSHTWIGQQIGMNAQNFHVMMTNAFVTRRTFEAIDKLYEQYSHIRRVATNRWEQGSISRTLSTAARNGWLPPAAYDDIDEAPATVIDTNEPDHAKLEMLISGYKVDITNAERRWCRDQLIERGWPAKRIDELLGYKDDATRKYIERNK